MQYSAAHRTDDHELTWSLTVASDARALTLEYEVLALAELYLSDRLWDEDRTGRRIVDPFGVYRFVEGDGLWLVFAQAPWLPEVSPMNVYTPLCSRVRAGEVRRGEVRISLPVDEYSALARNIAADTEPRTVTRVTLVLGQRLRSTMAEDPRPPAFESAEQVGYMVADLSIIVSSLVVEPLAVKRRVGAIARFTPPDKRP